MDPEPSSSTRRPDLVCFSHLRWDFVHQRPQHLMSRFAREYRVFYFEEFIFDQRDPWLHVTSRDCGTLVIVPHLPPYLNEEEMDRVQQDLIHDFFKTQNIEGYILWYFTPMAIGFTRDLPARLIVYDCMDELSLFRMAPPILTERENQLFGLAHLVFTGGPSLYAAKRTRHPKTFFFPSAIDTAHFAPARFFRQDPADQAAIPHPRLGYFGVIDERMDLDLLQAIAEVRPEWHYIMLGPVVKIDSESLPRLPNIHYLGFQPYSDLPAYLAGWDVALLPFARNASTRFVSPTKIPEYLAGGKPVVSTPIRDVIGLYAEKGLVFVAKGVSGFIAAVEASLRLNTEQSKWLAEVDKFLERNSWDMTFSRMIELIETEMTKRNV